jgi:hypothetical protein
VRIASTVALLVAVALLAGCGGGGGDGAAAEDATTEVTETTNAETTPGNDPGNDIDGSYTGSNAVCQNVTNSSSSLNTAASSGQFEVVADEWEAMAADAPAELEPDIETLVKGYRLVDEDPLGFGVLDTEPYKGAYAAVTAWTTANCGQ